MCIRDKLRWDKLDRVQQRCGTGRGSPLRLPARLPAPALEPTFHRLSARSSGGTVTWLPKRYSSRRRMLPTMAWASVNAFSSPGSSSPLKAGGPQQRAGERASAEGGPGAEEGWFGGCCGLGS